MPEISNLEELRGNLSNCDLNLWIACVKRAWGMTKAGLGMWAAVQRKEVNWSQTQTEDKPQSLSFVITPVVSFSFTFLFFLVLPGVQ